MYNGKQQFWKCINFIYDSNLNAIEMSTTAIEVLISSSTKDN